MEKVFVLAFIITVLYCFMKFIEAKYLDKEWKPLKYFVRDAILVFSSSLVATYVIMNLDNSMSELFNVVTDSNIMNASATQIFTDDPGF